MWMLVVRASDCQCQSRSRFHYQHPPTQWNLEAADEAVLNKVLQKYMKIHLKKS
jgi:hypothetical protein